MKILLTFSLATFFMNSWADAEVRRLSDFCIFQMSETNVPSADIKTIPVPGSPLSARDSALKAPIITNSNLIATGSADRNIYFYDVNGSLRSAVKAGWYINNIHQFKNGVVAAPAADGFVYFMNSRGSQFAKVKYSDSSTQSFSTIYQDTLVVSTQLGAQNQTVTFINSLGEIVKTYTFNGKAGTADSMMGLSGDPFEVAGLGLILPGSNYSYLLSDLSQTPVRFEVPAWARNFSIIESPKGKTIVSLDQNQLLFAKFDGKIFKKEPNSNSGLNYQYMALFGRGRKLITLTQKGEINTWNENGDKLSSLIFTEELDHDGVRLIKEPAPYYYYGAGPQILNTSKGYAIVTVVETIHEKDSPGASSAPSPLLATFYPIGPDGQMAKGRTPVHIPTPYGNTNASVLPMDSKYALIQTVTASSFNKETQFNIAYVVDLETFRVIARVNSRFTLTKPVKTGENKFIFTEAGPSGNIIFAEIRQNPEKPLLN